MSIGQFDKVVSIGVLEHAGRDQLDEVVARARAISQARRARHAALHRPRRPGSRPSSSSAEHVFPGGWIPSLARHDRGDGALRAGGHRHREPAPALRARRSTPGPSASTRTGRRSTRSIRGASTSASAASGAPTWSAAPRCSARRHGHTAPVPDRLPQGQRRRDTLSDEPALLYESAPQSARAAASGAAPAAETAVAHAPARRARERGSRARRERLVLALKAAAQDRCASARPGQAHLEPVSRSRRRSASAGSTCATSTTCSRSTPEPAGSTSRA